MTAKGSHKQKKKPEDDIHVKVDNPKWLRKEVLTTAIDLINVLKRYESYVELNKHKEHLLKLLKSEMSEVKSLMKELKLKELPLSSKKFNQLKFVKEEKEEVAKEQKAVEREEKKHEREVARQKRAMEEREKPLNELEADLNSLREKLASI